MICEGNSFSKGNMTPVALVRMVVMRKRAVRPGIDCDLNSPNKTTRPATIATRLMTTCRTVTACKLKPSIMMQSPCWIARCYGRSVEIATASGALVRETAGTRNDRVMEFLQRRHGDDKARTKTSALECRLRGVVEVAVQRGNDLRALADRAADALDRPRTHIADRENAWHRRIERRCGRRSAVWRARDDKTGAIDLHAAALEPAGGRIGAHEQEKIAGIKPVFLGRKAAAPAHTFERTPLGALKSRNLGIEYQFNIRRRLDALDQIARHAGGKTAAADNHLNLAGMAGQEDRGLAGGIAAANQDDLLLGTQTRLDRGGPVPDTPAVEVGET